mgnify:CR=1 FL=1
MVRSFLDSNEQLLDAVFYSQTQSYREVLLGCALIRLLDKGVNIRLPYIKHGKGAFNGRTLDEKVINPFLQDKLILCAVMSQSTFLFIRLAGRIKPLLTQQESFFPRDTMLTLLT